MESNNSLCLFVIDLQIYCHELAYFSYVRL